MKNAEKNLPVQIYQSPDGTTKVDVHIEKETIWLSQKQMARLFDVDVRTINEHIGNIFRSSELEQEGVIRKFQITASDGKKYMTNHYNLDMIISVGYRVNSKQATQFRIRATQTLKQHITQGYTINPDRISHNYEQFLEAVEKVKNILPNSTDFEHSDVLELVKLFADTWFSLDAFDNEQLPSSGVSKKQVEFNIQELEDALVNLKQTLEEKGEATALFGLENRVGNLAGIVGNVFQGFAGKDVYPSLEEKAAHLLYFIIKNHPFVDGNKRSGAFAFVRFLKRFGMLDPTRLSPEASQYSLYG